MKRILYALFCVFALVLGLFAPNLSAAEQNASVKEAASQISDEKAPAFPALTGRVVDQAGVLSQEAKDELETALAAHEANTTNQVVVVTLESLGGAPIEEYSLELGRRWGIGQKGKDNGALLVVAPNDRQVRIEVGYGLEGTLTDALSSNIINYYIIPEFKNGSIENGVKIGAQKILALLDGDEEAKKEIESKTEDYEPSYEVYGIMGGIAMIMASAFLGDMIMNIGLSVMLGSVIGLFVNSIFGFEGIAAIAVVLGIAALFYYLVKDVKVGKGGGGSSSSGSGSSGSSGGGRSSGGGFSGGGGSFGGGGASGRW